MSQLEEVNIIPSQCPSCGSSDIKLIYDENSTEPDEGWYCCQNCGEEWDDTTEEWLEEAKEN